MGAKFSSGGGATVFYDKTDTPGEIVTELVNASDGQGLNFDGAAGNIHVAADPDLGTKATFEFVVSADSASQTSYIFDYGTSGRTIFALNSGSLRFYSGGWSDFSVSTLDDLKVHHLCVTVDGTAAVLYDNGNQVGTATLTSNLDTESAADLRIGSHHLASSNFFAGTIYRCRFYNKALTSAEVQTAFERSDVPFADHYGSASNEITNGNFETNTSGWTSENTSVFQRNTTSPISGTGDLKWTGDGSGYPGAISNSFSLTAGKKYRIKFTYRVTSGTVYLKFGKTAGAASAAVAGISEVALTAASNTAYEATVEPTETTTAYIVFRGNNNTTPTMFVDLVDFVQIGCVSDYQTQWANPTQSLTVQDASGNADGTCSASGVTQVQPVVQLNSTSARIGTTAATPADGELLVSGNLGVGCDPSRELEVSGSGNVYARITAQTASDSTALELKNTADTWTIVNDDTASEALKFKNSAGTKLTIDSTGQSTFTRDGGLAITSNRTTDDGDAIHVRKDNYTRLRLGTLGITFPNGAGAAPTAAAANQLDYYEEATWTPTVGGDATYSAQTGRYTRVGRLVTATFDLTINAIGTGSTYIVSGLPFTEGDSIGAGGTINYYSSLAISPVLFAPTVVGTTVHIRSATAAATSPSNHGLLANGSRIAGIVTYTV